jgi:D-alanyl-D-alanine carboxypeptidase (penicillin-binding protein 5/6)
MARYASRYPEFNAATRTKVRQIKRSSGSKDTVLKNHAKFLWKFPGADGIKTGWTVPAGKCFVGGATRNGWRLISVVMHSPDLPAETSVLMKYGFEKFERVRGADAGTSFGAAPVEDGTCRTVPAVTKTPIYVVKPRGVQTKIELRTKLDAVRAPITAGMHVGEVEVYSDGLLASKTELVASAAVGKSVAAVSRRAGRPWYFGFVALVGVIGLGYGSSFAKAARIRRRRLKSIMRSADHRW